MGVLVGIWRWRASSLAASATSFAEVAFTDNALTVLSGANLSSRSASLADIDGDGDLDLLIVGGTTANPATNSPKLYRNDLVAGNPATLSYTDVTSTMLPSTGLGPSWSSAWGDYNGDGKIDLYIGESNNDGADLESGDLLRNNGAAGFSNESENTGLNDFGFAQNVAWADINNDHRLDLLIGMEGEAAHPEEKHQIYLQDALRRISRRCLRPSGSSRIWARRVMAWRLAIPTATAIWTSTSQPAAATTTSAKTSIGTTSKKTAR